MEERAAELEKAVAYAEATAEKGRTAGSARGYGIHHALFLIYISLW